MQKRVWGVLVGLTLVSLTLTGCLRQAAEPFDSDANADSNTSAAPIPTLNDGATLPLIFTVSAPTFDTSSVTQDAPTDATATSETPPLIVTVAPTVTAEPTSSEFIIPTVDIAGGTAEGSGQTDTTFITPGSPLNPTILDTPLPTLTETPLVAPTTPGSSGGQDTGDDGGSDSADLPDDCIHIVVSGDTLFNIALAYETNVTAIRAANPSLVGDIIQPGEEIQLPDCEGGLVVAPPTGQPTATSVLPPGSRVHVVASGETLFIIAQRYETTVDALVAANNLSNPNRIDPGQELIIP